MLIDGGVQAVWGVMSNNWRRLVTGILGGYGLGVIFWNGVDAGVRALARWSVGGV